MDLYIRIDGKKIAGLSDFIVIEGDGDRNNFCPGCGTRVCADRWEDLAGHVNCFIYLTYYDDPNPKSKIWKENSHILGLEVRCECGYCGPGPTNHFNPRKKR